MYRGEVKTIVENTQDLQLEGDISGEVDSDEEFDFEDMSKLIFGSGRGSRVHRDSQLEKDLEKGQENIEKTDKRKETLQIKRGNSPMVKEKNQASPLTLNS